MNKYLVKRFRKHVKRVCDEYDVTLDLRRAEKVKVSANIKCTGYFDGEERRLVVAMNHKDSLGILVHEFCHLMQYIEYTEGKFRLWGTATKALAKIDAWLEGEPITNLARNIGYARSLELDNEKRTVAMIKKWQLPIDLDDYIRKANAYVLSYNWVHKKRRWSVPPHTPYNTPLVYNGMSNKFNMKYSHMSRRIQELFEISGM